MIRVFVKHQVEDFAEWKRVYDAFDETRTEMGVTDDAVFQATDDPDDVTVWHDFDDMDAAGSFMESQELRSTMEEAGVVGEPMVWFTEPV